MEYEKKRLLYKSNVEYADYAINLAQGCSHCCTYPCYAYLMAKRFGTVKNIEEWGHPKIVSNCVEKLEKELLSLKNKRKLPEMVQFCFTTDPFMYKQKDICMTSLLCIRRCNEYGIPVSVLTKGLLPGELETQYFNNENIYGITIVSEDEKFRKKYEPGAAPIALRLNALKKLQEAGLHTWLSIEPYPTPDMAGKTESELLNNLKVIIDDASDKNMQKIIFGRIHYRKLHEKENYIRNYYHKCSRIISDICIAKKIDFLIKKGTDMPEEI